MGPIRIIIYISVENAINHNLVDDYSNRIAGLIQVPSSEDMHSSLRSRIQSKISEQIARMMEHIAKNKGHCGSMNYEIDECIYELKIARARPNGSCLFASIAHQLFGGKINSRVPAHSASNLRHNVVNYIKDNYKDFEEDIIGHMLDIIDDENDITNEKCQEFVDTILPKSYTWGGSETFKAVILMHKVNILVFNEYGNCYFICGFDPTAEKILLLAYRLSSTAELDEIKRHKSIRNHYDSIVQLPHDDIFMISSVLQNYFKIKSKRIIFNTHNVK